MPTTIYSESHFLIVLEVVNAKSHLVKTVFGEETLAVIKDALIIAANDAAMSDADPDPDSAESLAMCG